jgi:hypothetical protein
MTHKRLPEDQLAAISMWVDASPANMARDAEAATWGRLSKVAEECGEVIAAYIGVTSQNPRKGITHTDADVCKELLDVAVTALAAYEHMTGNMGAALEALDKHINYLYERTKNGNTTSDATGDADSERMEHRLP